MSPVKRLMPFNAEQAVNILSEFGPLVLMFIVNAMYGIAAGTWAIAPSLTLPVRPLGLPLEEAVFFLVTNLVLVNGLLLAADPAMWARVRAARRMPLA